MLALFTVFVVASFLFFTFGELLIDIYNRICKQNESYNFYDKLILGLCLFTIPTSISAFWVASNQYVVFACLSICVAYWCLSLDKLKLRISRVLSELRSLSIKQLSLIAFFVVVLMLLNILNRNIFDALFYHQQFIRWCEEYPIIPGLANIEDRFGFNSNYLLVSAPFTFRFLFNEAIYGLIPLFAVSLGCWLFIELFRSKYEFKRVIVFFCFVLFGVIAFSYGISNTSTDLLPNIIIFYIVARYIFYSDSIEYTKFFGVVVPAFLITCKLSTLPCIFISIYVLYLLFKVKDYRTILFLSFIVLLIGIPWLIRNIIISGYLVYPLYQIDLFSFDWKLPKDITMKQNKFITQVGNQYFDIVTKAPLLKFSYPTWLNVHILISYIVMLGTAMALTVTLIRGKIKRTPSLMVILSMLFLIILIWWLNGPDHRFVSGAIFGIIMLGWTIFMDRDKAVYNKPIGRVLVGASTIMLLAFTLFNMGERYLQIKASDYESKRPLYSIIFRPYSYRTLSEATLYKKNHDLFFEEYKLDNGVVLNVCFGVAYSYDMKNAAVAFQDSKFVSLKCLEARGSRIEDGFRLNAECDNTIHPIK